MAKKKTGKPAKETTKRKTTKRRKPGAKPRRVDPESGDAIPPGQLGDWIAKVPEVLRDLAAAFQRTQLGKSKANAAFNTAKSNLIVKMREEGIERIPILNGKKVLVLTAEDTVKTEKPKVNDLGELDEEI